jgi:hypothetical protein
LGDLFDEDAALPDAFAEVFEGALEPGVQLFLTLDRTFEKADETVDDGARLGEAEPNEGEAGADERPQ